MASVYLNDIPIETYGVVVTALTGWINLPQTEIPAIDAVGYPGPLPVGMSPRLAPRQMAVTCYVNAASSQAEKRSQLAALALAAQGLVEVSVDDDPSRVSYAVLTDGEGNGISEQVLAHAKALLILRFTAHDPYYYQRTPTLLALRANTRETIPLGSAPVRGVVGINAGGSGIPGMVLRHRSGEILAQLDFDGVTLDTGDSLEISHREGWADQYDASGSAWTSVMAYLGAGQDFCVFDPMDAPTLELLNGYDGWCLYRKADLV